MKSKLLFIVLFSLVNIFLSIKQISKRTLSAANNYKFDEKIQNNDKGEVKDMNSNSHRKSEIAGNNKVEKVQKKEPVIFLNFYFKYFILFILEKHDRKG